MYSLPSTAGNVSIGRRALHRLQLVVERFLLDARRLGLRDRAVEVRQPLHDDVLPVLDGDGVVLSPCSAGAAASLSSTFFRCSASCPVEPVGRVLRGGERELEVLLDVGLRMRVGHVGGQLRLRRRDAEVHQPAVANRHDGERAEDEADVCARTGSPSVCGIARAVAAGFAAAADHRRLRERRRAPCTRPVTRHRRLLRRMRLRQRRVLDQLHRHGRAPRQAPALQDPVLRLVEVVVVPAVLLLEHRVQAGDLRRVLLDEDLRARLVERRGAVAVDRADVRNTTTAPEWRPSGACRPRGRSPSGAARPRAAERSCATLTSGMSLCHDVSFC